LLDNTPSDVEAVGFLFMLPNTFLKLSMGCYCNAGMAVLKKDTINFENLEVFLPKKYGICI